MKKISGAAICASVVFGASTGAPKISATPPHIFFVLVDDLGWGDVGFNRAVATPEVATPTMDAIVREGVHLRRHYVHKMCTPTRTSVQSGRLPVHVSTSLANPEDPSCGIPRNMTGLAKMLKQAGYKTHQVGKWDAGMATPQHTPQGRGYDTSLGYFEHKNDFWSMKSMQTTCSGTYDLWDTDRPAFKLAGSAYEEYVFRDRMATIVAEHDPADPLLLFYTPHVAHCPLQVPADVLARFANLTDGTDETQCSAQTAAINPEGSSFSCRAQYAAMVSVLDDNLANVTAALKAKGMWDNTLMIFSSDNGGPVDTQENAANNFPLRGGKYSEWEGGVRAAAFAGGGFIPEAARGTVSEGMIAIADWYGTFALLAGVDPTDHSAAASGLPPIDSVDVWPLVTGANKTSPRFELLVDANCFVQGDYKLIRGKVAPSGWAGVVYPNASTHDRPIDVPYDCGSGGCLFNVVEDEGEHHDLAASMPDKLAALDARRQEWVKTIWQNHEKGVDACPPNTTGKCACWMAENVYAGFMGPYQEVPNTPPSYPTPVPPPPPPPTPTPGGAPCPSQRPPKPTVGQDVQLDEAADTRAAKQQWDYDARTGALSLHADAKLCMSIEGNNARGNPNVALATCKTSDPGQRWLMSSSSSAGGALTNPGYGGKCLDIQGSNYELELYACNGGSNQHFTFSPTDGRLTVTEGARKGLAAAVC